MVEVAYATAERQMILQLQVNPGVTAREVVMQSNIDQYFPQIDKQNGDIGVFGKAVKADYIVESGDRIEIYRPLIADPKEVRRRRAAEGKMMKKGAAKAASEQQK